MSTILPFPWIEVKDGNPIARQMYERHYSARATRPTFGRAATLFVEPGQKMVLMTVRFDSLLVWRNCISDAGQEGIYCAVFRNEGRWLSSWLLRVGMWLAWERWGQQRLYTYVDPRQVRSNNPGYCFKSAGWRGCGRSKKRKLHIFECSPTWLDQDDPARVFALHHHATPFESKEIVARANTPLYVP